MESAPAAAQTAECAICFDAVTDVFALPCDCNVFYCMRCWDRALAQSFNSVGQARCPTCRLSVRVDFDAEANRLVFSREPDTPRGASMDDESGTLTQVGDAIERLVEQARPAQIRILKQYGEQHPILQELAKDPEPKLRKMSIADLKRFISDLNADATGCVEKDELVRCIGEAVDDSKVASYWAGREEIAPHCVCGSSLSRVTGKKRASEYLRKHFPTVPENMREAYMSRMPSSSIICDLCDETIDWNTAVWTCTNGDSTILHATAYDVCDDCFICHTCGDDMPQDASEVTTV